MYSAALHPSNQTVTRAHTLLSIRFSGFKLHIPTKCFVPIYYGSPRDYHITLQTYIPDRFNIMAGDRAAAG